MKAIIPMAGKGTRLRPHTHMIPKPLVRVAGKEVLGHILDKVQNLGITEVDFVVGHMQDKLEDYLRQNYPGFKSRTIVQDELKGTAHAIKLTKDYFDQDALIIFADTLYDADLSQVKNLPSDIDGVIWVKEVEDYHKYGVIVADKKGLMKKIIEKPDEPISKLANIGLHYIRNHNLLFEGIEHTLKQPAVKGEYYLTDSLQYMVDQGAKIKILPVTSWLDCGHPEALLLTNKYLLENGLGSRPPQRAGVVIHDPVRIEPNVTLENAEIGPNVTIESGSVVKNSVIRESIIGQNTVVEDSILKKSLVGREVEIRNIKGSVNILDHSVITGHEDAYDRSIGQQKLTEKVASGDYT